MPRAMNKQQREYALNRVDQIKCDRIKSLQEVHKIEDAATLANEDMVAFLEGTCDLVIQSAVNIYSVRQVFDLSEYEHGEMYDDEYEDEIAELNASVVRVKDAIMLGDCEAALLILANFAGE